MSAQIPIQKTLYRKDQIGKVRNNSFTTFLPNQGEEERTVEQFFEDYERLFFRIPPEGENSSHRYLVERSSTLLNLEQNTLDIQPLLDEIASLREELLTLRTENLTIGDTQIKISKIIEDYNQTQSSEE